MNGSVLIIIFEKEVGRGSLLQQKMHHQREERKLEEILLSISQSHSSLPRIVADRASDICSGWKLTFPSPTYYLQVNTTKKERKHLKYPSTKGQYHNHKTSHGYTCTMGGHLNKDSDYVYEGGLSSRVTSGNSTTSLPQLNPPPKQQPYKITLKPVTLNKRANNDMTQIVDSQLKPDIFYEQMLIEQNLQTLKLPDCHFPIIEGVGELCPPIKMPVHSVSIDQFPNVWKKDMSLHRKKVRKRRKDLNAFDWSDLHQSTSLIKKNGNVHSRKSENAVQTSFSRLLESSSVMFSYKRKI